MVIIFFLFLIFSQPVFAESTPTSVSTVTSIPTPTTTSTISPPVTLTTTPTSTPEITPTVTLTTTPTPNPTIINPDTGISLSEFMPYSSLEWIEIYNNNDKPVELRNWKLKNNSANTKIIPDLKILPKSYGIFEFFSFLNNDNDKIVLINHNDQIVSQYEYPNNKLTLERSWSLISNSWCQANITQNSANVSSCYLVPTPTVINNFTTTLSLKPSIRPTEQNLYVPDESATASAVFTPIEEPDSETNSTIPTSVLASNLVLGQTTTTKRNYLPIIFIVLGGFLLLFPIFFEKFKKK